MATESSMGYKDKEKALETIQFLEGRDPDYQKLAVKGLIGRARRTLQVTKAEDKLTNIKEAVDVFEKWLKDFDKLNLPNWKYLPFETIEVFLPWKKHLNIEDDLYDNFFKVYKTCDADYKKVRSVNSEQHKLTWDIVRNNKLKELLKQVDDENLDLWDKEDLPTKIHTELIFMAYSPDANKIKKELSSLQTKLEQYKSDNEEEEEDSRDSGEKNLKRKHDDNSDKSENTDSTDKPKRMK